MLALKKNKKQTLLLFPLPSRDLVVKAFSEEKTERGMHRQTAFCTKNRRKAH